MLNREILITYKILNKKISSCSSMEFYFHLYYVNFVIAYFFLKLSFLTIYIDILLIGKNLSSKIKESTCLDN